MIINARKHTISDPFTLITTGTLQEKIGLRTFRYTSRITGEPSYIQIDPHAELLAQAVAPLRKAVLLNMLSNIGFLVSPLPGSLDTFLHILLFPDDAISLLGSVKTEPLPDDAVVEIITTCEIKESQHEH